MLLGIEDYPFDEMTDRYAFRVECRANWKVFSDAFMEFYHAPVVHVGQHPVHLRAMITQMGYEAPHYQIDGPHGLVTTAGSLHRVWEMPPENVKPADIATRSGLFGPWDQSDLGELPPGINPGKINPWGLSSFQFFPNFADLDLGGGLVQHPPVLADVAQHARLRGQRVLPAGEVRLGAGGAGDGGGVVQGVLAAGRQHPRGHAAGPRVAGDRPVAR